MTDSERMRLEIDLAERSLKLANLQVDTALKAAQHAFLPWQFAVTAFAAGAGLVSAIWAIVKWQVGG